MVDYNIDIEIYEDEGYMVINYGTDKEGLKSTRVDTDTVEGAELLNRFLSSGNFHGTSYSQDEKSEF